MIDAQAPSTVLQELRDHLAAHPQVQHDPLALHQRGMLFHEVLHSATFHSEGFPSFAALCAALSVQFSEGDHGSAVTAIDIYEGFTKAELRHCTASARLLTQLLAVPRPRRAQLLDACASLSPDAAKDLIVRALRGGAPPSPAPAEDEATTPLDRVARSYLDQHHAFMTRLQAVLQRWEGGEPLQEGLLVLLKHAIVESRTQFELITESTAARAREVQP